MDAILQDRIYENSIFGTHDAWCFCEAMRLGVTERAGVHTSDGSPWSCDTRWRDGMRELGL